jgi:hypothetical protein
MCWLQTLLQPQLSPSILIVWSLHVWIKDIDAAAAAAAAAHVFGEPHWSRNPRLIIRRIIINNDRNVLCDYSVKNWHRLLEIRHWLRTHRQSCVRICTQAWLYAPSIISLFLLICMINSRRPVYNNARV